MSSTMQQHKLNEDNRKSEPPFQKQYMQLPPIKVKVKPAQSLDGVTSTPEYAHLSPSTRSFEVSRHGIAVEKVIGKCAFGQVAKGTATDLRGRNGKTTVAIKMLKSMAYHRTIGKF